MDLFDDGNGLLSKGSSRVKEAAKIASLRSRAKDLKSQRSNACARLGGELYSLFKDNCEVRISNQALFECIENIDSQILAIQYDLALLERQRSVASLKDVVCLKCGAMMSETDSFCPKCGRPVRSDFEVAEVKGGCCPRCGTPFEADQSFCMKCGNRIG